jgi:hypothetical protein
MTFAKTEKEQSATTARWMVKIMKNCEEYMKQVAYHMSVQVNVKNLCVFDGPASCSLR